MISKSPQFRIFPSPEFGENKSLEFGLYIKPRKWDIYENIAKQGLLKL